MTISRQDIGSLLNIGFHGSSSDDEGVKTFLAAVREGLVGGTCLFSYNIESAQQVKLLTGAIREAAGNRPFTIAVDQEGGKVARFREENGFRSFSSAEQLASCSPSEAYDSSFAMATMLKDLGIDLNFAPCVDVDATTETARCPVIGALGRSFSADTDEVAECAQAFINGHHAAGVHTCLKHFPGHGRALTDSHKGLTDITETWTAEELLPYKKLIAERKGDFVMPGHLIHRNYDESPATLSRHWITELRSLGFTGPIVTDDLHMGAIVQYHTPLESAVAALEAGCTVPLFSNNPAGAHGVDFQVNHELAFELSQELFELSAEDETFAGVVFEATKILSEYHSNRMS